MPAAFARCAAAPVRASLRQSPVASTSLIVSVTGMTGTAAPVMAGSLDRARDHGRRNERPRGVVDQDDVGLRARERFKAGMHRRLPRSAAVRGRLMAQTADRGIEHRDVLGVQNRLHRKDLGMTAKRLHGPENHGLSADRPILLGSTGAGAKAAAGCDKDGCSPLGFRHGGSIAGERRVDQGDRCVAHCPYHAGAAKQNVSRSAWEKRRFVAVHLQCQRNCLNCRHDT